MLIKILFGLIVLIVAFFVFWRCIFLRDPHRAIAPGRVIVSPCDGKVLKVMSFDAKRLRVKKGIFGKIHALTDGMDEEGTLVSIFMSPFVVHVTRNPLTSKVLSITHRDGKLLPVTSIETGLINEHVEYLMDSAIGRFKMFLIAGFLARRIEPWVRNGQVLKTGERNGRINLGSQVTLLLPKKAKITAKEGERLYAGSSVIGKY